MVLLASLRFKGILSQNDIFNMKHLSVLKDIVLMANPTQDGRVDYIGFASAFSKQAKDIAFSYVVLIKSLGDRLDNLGIYSSSPLIGGFMQYFDSELGRIDIVGRDGVNVERVYFPIYPVWREQWLHPQITRVQEGIFLSAFTRKS